MKKSTIIRTITLIIALLNQCVAVFIHFGITEDPTYQAITVIITTITATLSWYCNNDVTKCKVKTGNMTKMLKDNKITQEEVEELIKNHNNQLNSIDLSDKTDKTE